MFFCTRYANRDGSLSTYRWASDDWHGGKHSWKRLSKGVTLFYLSHLARINQSLFLSSSRFIHHPPTLCYSGLLDVMLDVQRVLGRPRFAPGKLVSGAGRWGVNQAYALGGGDGGTDQIDFVSPW